MKIFLEDILDQMEAKERGLKDGEYLGDDGLVYYEKCHTPVQCRKEFLGKMRILPCICKCRQEEMRREKEDAEARERMNLIQRMKTTGIQERHLLDWRFDVAEDTETIRWARQYVQNWKKVRAENLAYQIRQSLKPGEVTAEEANQIGYELAMAITKGKHAFIVATHTDRPHIHNHIVCNSTSLDCRHKFRDFKHSGLALQHVSDRICLEHGLSVIIPKPYKDRRKRTAYPKKPRFRDGICAAIDQANTTVYREIRWIL